MRSRIEWTDRSDWNPIRGCTRVSEGCRNCYAERMAGRFSEPGLWGHGIAERTPAGARWTGEVAIQWDRLDLPLRWRKRAMIFASSTSDWFHEKLPASEIATLFAVAVAAVHVRRHTVQILTKRAGRMREVLNTYAFWNQVNAEAGAHVMEHVDPLDRCSDDARATLDDYGPDNPPPGIWLGVSADDQRCADERIPRLLATPAAVRFVSAEPLLGPINLRSVGGLNAIADRDDRLDHAIGRSPPTDGAPVSGSGLDWVIVGGESGPQARPMHPDWARGLRDQSAGAGVPFFFKRHGEWIGVPDLRRLPGGGGPGFGSYDHCSYDQEHEAVRVGRARSGRLLDGREHNEMPEARR